jgi:hypothetical protein
MSPEEFFFPPAFSYLHVPVKVALSRTRPVSVVVAVRLSLFVSFLLPFVASIIKDSGRCGLCLQFPRQGYP